MPKRKRDEAEYPFTSPSGRHRLPRVPQPKRVEEKLHYAKKLLHRALKLARGFERQKLGRRHKAAVKKQVDVERLDAEIHALKVRLNDFTAPVSRSLLMYIADGACC